jgi:hypothetical protein
MTTEDILKSNKSYRSKGAVGNRSVVSAWVKDNAPKHYKILDFGAGKDNNQVRCLQELGFKVSGYEFGENQNENHIVVIHKQKYDLIYASNVFNTHSNAHMSATALHLIKNGLKKHGWFVFNLPKSPRYFWNEKDLLKLVTEIFGIPAINMSKSKNIYMIIRDPEAETYLI